MNKIRILLAMPIYKRELLALNSIRSIVDLTVIDKTFDVTLALGVNEMNEELDSFLENFKTTKMKIDVNKFDSNLGKGIAVNKLASKYEFDFIISIDSDMICIDAEWLKKMVFVYFKYNEEPAINRSNKQPRPLGSLCSNQMGYCCHMIDKKDPKRININIEDKFNIISHVSGDGVAGGVLMSDAKTWKLIGGYHGGKLYATDDGHYNRDCHQKNKLVGYVEEVYFYHPHEFNDSYRQWKNKIVADKETFVPYKTEQIMKGN